MLTTWNFNWKAYTIDTPEFAEYIIDIPKRTSFEYSKYFGTSLLDLNSKVISSNIHNSVYDKRHDFRFPISNFPWLSGDVPRFPSYGI